MTKLAAHDFELMSFRTIHAVHYCHYIQSILHYALHHYHYAPMAAKVNSPDIYMLPLRGKAEQRFTIRSCVLTSIISRQRSAISAAQRPNYHTLELKLNLQPAARQTHLCPRQLLNLLIRRYINEHNTARCTLVQSAVLPSHVVRLSVSL